MGCKCEVLLRTWLRTLVAGAIALLLFGAAFRLLGRLLFRGYAREVVANLERLDATPADPAWGAKAVP